MRRAGAIHAFDSINHFFLINEMIIPGSSYWNIGIGREKGEVLKDEEGLNTMKVLGENMAWLLKKTKGKKKERPEADSHVTDPITTDSNPKPETQSPEVKSKKAKKKK